jgi:hypothetical protein
MILWGKGQKVCYLTFNLLAICYSRQHSAQLRMRMPFNSAAHAHANANTKWHMACAAGGNCNCPIDDMHMPNRRHAHANTKWHMACAAGGNCPINAPNAKSRPSRMHMPMWLHAVRFLVDASFTYLQLLLRQEQLLELLGNF